MERYELCKNIIWQIDDLAEMITNYQKSPRTYGTDTPLYMQQMHTLSIIGQNPDININSLCRLSGKTKPTISQQLTRLAQLGFITKTRKDTNQREICINLTEKGQQAFEHHESEDTQYYKLIIDEMAQFTIEELAIVERFIKASIDAFVS